MWIIDKCIFYGISDQPLAFSDGLPIYTPRGENGSSCRLFIGRLGFLDLTDLGTLQSGEDSSGILINGKVLYYSGAVKASKLTVTISAKHTAHIQNERSSVMVALMSYPQINPADIQTIHQMEQGGYIPFRNDPNTYKNPAEIRKRLQQLGEQYFPFTDDSYELALSIYDWTTADFFRMDLFHLYCYTAMAETPRNLSEMADGLASSDWGTYKITNADFMNSFMLPTMEHPDEVMDGLQKVESVLGADLNALARVTMAAKYLLPRISLTVAPMLYSGQVAIQNLGNDAMAAYFMECPCNRGPVGMPISMAIDLALNGFMAPGKVVTLKSFISFTADPSEAEQYSNGLLLVLQPKPDTYIWGEGITNITPFSDAPTTKNEYTFSPGAQLKIERHENKIINNRELTVIYMTYLDQIILVPGIG
ncbi:hypothetical protein [Celerinatantimonas sp. YJH-8]|uniref:hypothetical protein n=1 Tax=Celerinatantimonas sp. YJH-8 TaxID=3228714 RepID=UPI0038C46CBA